MNYKGKEAKLIAGLKKMTPNERARFLLLYASKLTRIRRDRPKRKKGSQASQGRTKKTHREEEED